MVAENEKIATHPWIAWGALTGERRTEPAPFPFAPGPDGKAMPLYRHSRPKFHQMLINQLERDGMSIDYGCRATEYIDASEGSKPAVILADGRRLEADLVVAADGVGSHSNRLTRGELANAVYSGSSIYRASLPLETALADEEIRTRFKKMDDGRPIVEMWTG